MSAQAVTEWNELYDRYYTKREVYSMLWGDPSSVGEHAPPDLSKYVVAAAPFGGPVAMVRDDKKILLLKNQSLRPRVYIYTAAGRELCSFLWDKGRLVRMAWSGDEDLVCVLEDGTVLVYTVHGELARQFSLGPDCQQNGVLDCCVYSTGLVALSKTTLQLYAVQDFDAPRPVPLADPGLTEAPTCMAVIEPRFTLSGSVEVLVAVASGTILVVDGNSAQDQLITKGPFTKLAVSPTGQHLACFTSSGSLWVVSTDFVKNLSEFGTKSRVPPQHLAWCGTDSVVLFWEKILLMVGPYGHWIKYSADEAVSLVSEVDGCRIISGEKTEFLQRVPNSTESIFKIGSTSPAAMLFDAVEHFENIRTIRNELEDAVDACIDAAAHEFSARTQQQLLRAASYGKCFAGPGYGPEKFVETSRALRVLNNVRLAEKGPGMPLTYQQYCQLTPAVLIDRLANRHDHLLALRVCEYLGLQPDGVLVHWASAKVRRSEDKRDEEVRDEVCRKLKLARGVSYAEVARAAYGAGRPRLATMLLDYEPRAAEQVPLLMSMKEDELALAKAIESGDTDLVYACLGHLQKGRSKGEFFQIVARRPLSRDLFIKQCRDSDPELLRTFFYNTEQPWEAANMTYAEAFRATDLDGRFQKMKVATEIYKKSKDHGMAARACEDQLKLLLIQTEIDRKMSGLAITDTSLADSIYLCMLNDQHKLALKLKTDFKVSDRQYWWLRVRALARTRQWGELEKLSKEKKSPIGYSPFVQVCIDAGAKEEAAKYVPKIPSAEERGQTYMRLGMFKEAAQVAVQLKDTDVLLYIRGQVDGLTQNWIDQQLATLK